MAGSARVGAWFAKNWFLIGLLAAVAVGLAAPRAGTAASLDGTTATVLVVVLFFLSGLSLPTEAIASGLRDVRLHLFLQAFIFVAVPLYFAASAALLWRGGDPRLLAGIYALAVLPTTVSSCIVFTQAARGNVVATIFNASLANVAGVFLSPLLLSLLLQQSGRALPADELLRVLTALALKMLLPFALGQLARARLRELAQRLRKAISVFMNASIVVIIWFSFSRPALDPTFAASLLRLWPLFGYLALSHLLLLGAVWGVTRALQLDKANTYTALFVAPQKTLAMGAPLLTTYFATMPDLLGVALLPLIMYHLWQLTVAGFLPRLLGPVEERPYSRQMRRTSSIAWNSRFLIASCTCVRWRASHLVVAHKTRRAHSTDLGPPSDPQRKAGVP